MAVPTTRKEFKDHCLRRLGYPVIEVNISEEQIDDKIDEALKYFFDYHYDGSHKLYLKHQITATDVTNGYIDIPEEIIGIVRVFPMSTIVSTGMFSDAYQLAISAFANLQSFDITSYYRQRQNLNVIEEVLVGQTPIRFNRHLNKLYIDTNWGKATVGNYIIVEAYALTDPMVYTDVWKDIWLQKYTTELMREQWGINLTKFIGMQLPGGVQFNGEGILNMARENIKDLENEMISSYSVPPSDFIG